MCVCIQMANNASCCNRELGPDAAQTRTSERQNLRRAIKRAAKAQRRLHKAIYSAQTFGEGANTSSSSSESDGEETECRGRRSAGEGGRSRFIPYPQGPWTRRHGMHGAHGPWASMRGFPSGRHMMGFPGFGAGFPGMRSHGVGPHPHPHLHHHHHGHGHHHHHRGAFGDFHLFGGHGGHCGRSGKSGHGHGNFGRNFSHFGGVGHRSGRRERAQSVPRF